MTQRMPKDIYGRPATSQSRGRTHERILAMQHAPESLPGADELLDGCPDGSLGWFIRAFHHTAVSPRPVTSRRAYERTLVFFARDCGEQHQLAGDPGTLTLARVREHLSWRERAGMVDPAETKRCGVHLSRLAAHIADATGTPTDVTREALANG